MPPFHPSTAVAVTAPLFPHKAEALRVQVEDFKSTLVCVFLGHRFVRQACRLYLRGGFEAKLSQAAGVPIIVDGQYATGVVEEAGREAAQAKLVAWVRQHGSLIATVVAHSYSGVRPPTSKMRRPRTRITF